MATKPEAFAVHPSVWPPYAGMSKDRCLYRAQAESGTVYRLSIHLPNNLPLLGTIIIKPILLMGKLRPRERDLGFSSPPSPVLLGRLLSGSLKARWPSLGPGGVYHLFTLKKQMMCCNRALHGGKWEEAGGGQAGWRVAHQDRRPSSWMPRHSSALCHGKINGFNFFPLHCVPSV